MNKLETVACVIMEATTDPIKPEKLEVIDKNSLFYLKFLATLQDFDVFNRNRRNYAKIPMQESLRAPHILELIAKQSWKGEAGHPDTDNIKRILTVDPKLTSHKISRLDFIGNLCKGVVETLDDDAHGRTMTKNILQGMEPAFSLRALAQLSKQGDGSSLVRTRSHVVCYDWVIFPSHKVAYRDESQPIEKVVKLIESNGNSVTESVTIPVQESGLLDFIKLSSKNVKLVSNVCEVALESMTLTDDFKNVVIKENGTNYIVKIDDKVKRDITHFMANL